MLPRSNADTPVRQARDIARVTVPTKAQRGASLLELMNPATIHRPSFAQPTYAGPARALEASEGQRRKRKRDQTPDAFGACGQAGALATGQLKTIRGRNHSKNGCSTILDLQGAGIGRPTFAMARAVFEEWRLAHALESSGSGSSREAPSDDAPIRTK